MTWRLQAQASISFSQRFQPFSLVPKRLLVLLLHCMVTARVHVPGPRSCKAKYLFASQPSAAGE